VKVARIGETDGYSEKVDILERDSTVKSAA
jgi:hypothetical protein